MTSTKWSIGHTLAVSGALDFIAGCEALKNQHLFALANTRKVDPSFHSNYVLQSSKARLPEGSAPLTRFMITSLGFGGLHAAVGAEMATRS